MTAITKMFLSSSYSLSKNSHPHCVVFKIGPAVITSAAAESLHPSLRRGCLPTPCDEGVTESRSLTDTGDSGIPRHVLRSTGSNMAAASIKKMRSCSTGDRILTLNQVLSHFPAPPFNRSRNITHCVCLCVCVGTVLHVLLRDCKLLH